jgi:hypothetical protein
MKQKIWSYLLTLIIMMGFAACSNDDDNGLQELKKGYTYAGIKLAIPLQPQTAPALRSAQADPTDYNPADPYFRPVVLSTIDLYILSADGSTLLSSQRYTADQVATTVDAQQQAQIVEPKVPFETTPGDKIIYVILNSPQPLLAAAPTATDKISIASGSPTINDLASIQTITPGFSQELIMMNGKSAVTTILPGVTADEVKAGQNRVKLSVSRIVSQAIITTSPSLSANVGTMGTIANITYSIAQGANAVYYDQDTLTNTPWTTSWGYDYVPDATYSTTTTATQYYDYSDLFNTATLVPANSNTDPRYFLTLPGKFLLENTHKPGTDGGDYKKGNTAYILVRAKFTPNATTDGGALAADGTFYVGNSDGNIYSSIAKAQNASTGGIYPQDVKTYTAGKVLYFVWLNPDDIAYPLNSPVIRNNIYHININSFKTLGFNWNPLYPNAPALNPNPDPRPTNPEEPTDSPIVPSDPLSLEDTYMTVDITVLPWTVHSYNIDL